MNLYLSWNENDAVFEAVEIISSEFCFIRAFRQCDGDSFEQNI